MKLYTVKEAAAKLGMHYGSLLRQVELNQVSFVEQNTSAKPKVFFTMKQIQHIKRRRKSSWF